MITELLSLPVRVIRTTANVPNTAQTAWDGLQGMLATARSLIQQADIALARTERLVSRVEALVREADLIAAEARQTVHAASNVARDADSTADRARETVGRAETLMRKYEEPLSELAPLAVEAANTLSEEHIRALGRLLDLLPEVTEYAVPAVRNLAAMAPDLEEMTDRLNDVGEIIEGLPGAGLLRRRGRAAEDNAATDDETPSTHSE